MRWISAGDTAASSGGGGGASQASALRGHAAPPLTSAPADERQTDDPCR